MIDKSEGPKLETLKIQSPGPILGRGWSSWGRFSWYSTSPLTYPHTDVRGKRRALWL